MKFLSRSSLQIITILVSISVLLAVFGVEPMHASAAPAATILPTNTACTTPGTGTVTCELWAKPGTISLPGILSLPVWGYSDTSMGTAQVPGPILIAHTGDVVTVILHNNLASSTSLSFEGQGLIPDLTGVPPNGTKSYTFTTTNPGTFLYEAGLLPNTQHQVAMGLYGALIVRPDATPGQAYTDSSTAFNDEALLVLSEIDPALNNSANPANFDMRNFKPKFWLINGKAYPQTDMIQTGAGRRVLLRYLNASQQSHNMTLLGLYQKVLSLAGFELPFYRNVVSENLGPGQSSDAIALVPASAQTDTFYPLFEGNLMLHNNGALGFGGMLTFLRVNSAGMLNNYPSPTNSTTNLAPKPATKPLYFTLAADTQNLRSNPFTARVNAVSADVSGPSTSGISLTPNPTDGSVDVTIAATISDYYSDGSVIKGAEFFIDAMGASGTGTSLTPSDGSFNSSIEGVTGIISIATQASLNGGNHIIYIHGQDAANNWGSFNFLILNLDKIGPLTSGIVLTPVSLAGNIDVDLQATGNDMATGESDITDGEYFINDAACVPGAGNPLLLDSSTPVGPIASLVATIPVTKVVFLSEGSHSVYVHSRDSFGNWGDCDSTPLKIDRAGPTTGGLVAIPNLTNGSSMVRVNATFVDPLISSVNSNISTGELFIDNYARLFAPLMTRNTPDPLFKQSSPQSSLAFDPSGLYGNGLPMTPSDGAYNDSTEDAYAFITQAEVNSLTQGLHTIYVRGKDASGNWGVVNTLTLIIDKEKPVVSNVTASPNPTAGAANVTLTADSADDASNIAAAEWFRDADPGLGNGTTMSALDGTFDSTSEALTASIDISGWAEGDYTLYIRVKDAAGNWSMTSSTVLHVTPP